MKINRFEISEFLTGKIIQNESMSRHTTFRIGGCCDLYVEVKTVDELKNLIKYIRKKRIPYFILGAGSNLLVKDNGIKGIVIKLAGDFSKVEFDFKRKVVKAGSSCSLQGLIKKCRDNSLGGMEFLAGIPGTVGGAVVMNAGTTQGNIGSIVKSAALMDDKGKISLIDKSRLKFSYRSSNIKEKGIVLFVELMLKKMNKSNIMKNSDEVKMYRAKTQPIGEFNAGCIFKNPAGDFAARLIDDAGLKGISVGGAVVSNKHANYINNSGNASANDVLRLISKIRKKVKEKYNKKLELEIKVV
ncbi:MAG: UDP-N-acetylenolpyruvoylglucosamine reductase [Elusimicrobia bacterium RIFOXYC2_FULL_34_12]|nr:MAG: UDP-N-acetylenolpyruvoylglucosamine reductase [Elusimicrobia bacterium RIFOXYC2_FULL_34_12]OGS38324.1 MAG: UDP-N-acetylenolpyruvoylglucosamine reductase [Elusimicrobia bacterium RIFOXYD2_FULL_34_30]HAM39717.1 UDP-N-acetylenolpyruvoylglucosamine reductase [Elusimicrobiota bacterium]